MSVSILKTAALLLSLAGSVFGLFYNLQNIRAARQVESRRRAELDGASADSPRDQVTEGDARRRSLVRELQSSARIDELKATVALWLIPIVVIGGATLTSHFDDGWVPNDSPTLIYALVRRLGFLGVTFYLAHAAVSQYRYSTLRAAHYRACSQAINVCDDDTSLSKVYRMLLPPHSFGAAPLSPIDALVKIAGKDTKG